ncbi:hypothetical protein KSP40_PGU012393 [Platanthera guangdongensis]|uniref:Uncharacterized protein n=1 Tax=Platanthera guangdongensis TaxID=2320717 RepID=A0ABR2MRE8_9ASPA
MSAVPSRPPSFAGPTSPYSALHVMPTSTLQTNSSENTIASPSSSEDVHGAGIESISL